MPFLIKFIFRGFEIAIRVPFTANQGSKNTKELFKNSGTVQVLCSTLLRYCTALVMT